MTTRHPLTLACCILLAGSSVSIAADLVTLDGKTVQGSVLAVDGESLTYKGPDGQQAKISVKALAEVRLGNKPLPLGTAPYDEIELTDGSILKVANETVLLKKRAFTVAPVATGEGLAPPAVTLSADHVLYWVRKANTGTVRADWKLKIVEKRTKRDLLVLFNDTDGFQPTEGTVTGGSADGTKVGFQDTTGKDSESPLGRVTGGIVFYNPQAGTVPPTAGRVFDVFGNSLLATTVTIDDKGKVTVKTVSGAEVGYDSLAAIARMDFAQGNVKVLAELEPAVDAPAAVPGEPYQPFLNNKSREGSGLRVGGKPYTKGVWVAPETTLTYPLGGNYREFKAVVGIDDAVPVVTSKVTLVVELDGRKVVEETFDNATKAKKKVLDLNLNVKDVKELKITVGRESLFSGEGLNFADARLQK
jgi:hypothetical protein